MITKTITYKDYNGVEKTRDFMFNFSKAEIAEMELTVDGGFSSYIEKITAAQDMGAIIKTFKELLLKAYGEKSPDGERFVKSKDLSEAFSQTEAYSTLFMELSTNAEAASAFVNGLMNAVTGDHEVKKPALPLA